MLGGSSFFFEDYLVDLVASDGELSLVLSLSEEGVNALVFVVEVGVGDSEVAEDEALSRPEADLAVSEEQVVLVVRDGPCSFLQLVGIAGVEGHNKGILSNALRFEGMIGVASQHPSVFKFDQHQNIGFFVDVAMEVDLIQRVKSEQKLSSFNLEVIPGLNGFDDCLFVVAEVIEDFIRKVTLVVPLIGDLLEQFFLFSLSLSLPFAQFIDVKLQGMFSLVEGLHLTGKLLEFSIIFGLFSF